MSGMFTSIPATAKDVEFFAKHLTDAYIHCRTWGHDPEPHSIKVGPRGVYWDAKLRCAHGCGVKLGGTCLRRRGGPQAHPVLR